MPQVDLVREKSRRMPLIAAGVAVGLIVVVAAVVFVMIQMQAPKPDAEATLKQVRNLTFDNKEDEAIALLRDQLGKTKNNDDKLSLDMQLGAILEAKGNYAEAVEVYRAADQIKSGFGTRYAVARAAEAGGDKAVALEYYKKCQTMIKNGESKQNSDYLPLIEAAIGRLEAKS